MTAAEVRELARRVAQEEMALGMRDVEEKVEERLARWRPWPQTEHPIIKTECAECVRLDKALWTIKDQFIAERDRARKLAMELELIRTASKRALGE